MLTILFYYASSFFFLIIDLSILIAVVVTQIFNPIVELAIPIAISTKEAKVEMETNTVIAENVISDCHILSQI